MDDVQRMISTSGIRKALSRNLAPVTLQNKAVIDSIFAPVLPSGEVDEI